MKKNIWRVLAQILYDRNDLNDVIKPFLDYLNDESIHDEVNQLLQTFPNSQIEVLCPNRIQSAEVNTLIPNTMNLDINSKNTNQEEIESIISEDKIEKLICLIQKKNIYAFNPIIKPFKEVDEMKIPLIQFCIMKNAIKCFKYLLINGYDDPNAVMEDQDSHLNYSQKQYEWDCMATAIYFGNNEIIKMLKDKIEIEKIQIHIEAAILSYRNKIVEEIIDINKNNEGIQNNYLNKALLASSKNNNLKGAKLLILKGADINTKDIIYQNKAILF